MTVLGPQGDLALPLPRRTAWPAHLWLLLGLLALACLVGFEAVQSLVHTWSNTTTYTYGFLIPPIVGYLLWRERAWLAAAPLRTEPLALPALLGGSALLLVGEVAGTALLSELGFVSLLAAGAVLALGRRVARRLAFPLAFLFLMIPVGDGLIAPLQDVTAGFALPLVRLLGIPAFRDGVLIDTPAGQFQVAEACAGLRFLIANIVLGVLFAHLSYRSWRKKVLFLALCATVPIIANGLRATGIIAVASWTDMRVAASADHLIYGWGFFTVVMMTLLLIGNRFADPAAPAPLPEPGPAPAPRQRLPVLHAAAAAAAILAGPAYGWAMVRPPAGLLAAAVAPPPLAAGWARHSGEAPAWMVNYPAADRLLADAYGPVEDRIDVVVAYYTHQRQGAEVIYHANRPFDGERWRRVRSASLALPLRGALAQLGGPVPLDQLAGPDGRPRLAASWYWVDGRFTASAAVAKLLQLKATLAGGEPAAAVVVLSAADDDPQQAAARLVRFAAAADFTSYLRALGGH